MSLRSGATGNSLCSCTSTASHLVRRQLSTSWSRSLQSLACRQQRSLAPCSTGSAGPRRAWQQPRRQFCRPPAATRGRPRKVVEEQQQFEDGDQLTNLDEGRRLVPCIVSPLCLCRDVGCAGTALVFCATSSLVRCAQRPASDALTTRLTPSLYMRQHMKHRQPLGASEHCICFAAMPLDRPSVAYLQTLTGNTSSRRRTTMTWRIGQRRSSTGGNSQTAVRGRFSSAPRRSYVATLLSHLPHVRARSMFVCATCVWCLLR